MNFSIVKLTKLFDQCGFDLSSMRSIYHHKELVYNTMIYSVGIPQAILNIFVLLVVFLGCNMTTYRHGAKRYVLIFIVNLALADLAGFCLMSSAVHLSWDSYYGEFYKGVVDRFKEVSNSGCLIQTALWSYSYTNSLLATIFLTLERYFYVTRVFNYRRFVNRKTVFTALTLTWLLPFLSVISTTTSSYTNSEMCIPTHTETRYRTLAVGFIFLFVLPILYFLYIRILVKLWRIKQKNEKKPDQVVKYNKGEKNVSGTDEANNPTESISGNCGSHNNSKVKDEDEDDHLKKIEKNQRNQENIVNNKSAISNRSSINYKFRHMSIRNKMETPKWLKKIPPFLAASKYIIAILITYTLCWQFWISIYFGDIFYHFSGIYERKIREKCGISATNNWTDPITQPYIPQLQLCIYGLIAESQNYNLTSSDIPSDLPNCLSINMTSSNANDETIVCAEVYRHLHSTFIFYLVRLAKFLSCLNSVFNPIIYIQFSAEFRSLVKNVFNNVKTKF